MHADIHFMMATSLSMIMTLIIYCSLEGTKANDNLFQNIFADTTRDAFFGARCLLNNWQVTDICEHRSDSILCTEWYIFIFIVLLIKILHWLYGEIVVDYLIVILNLIPNLWLIARLCNAFNLWSQLDVFTVYFIICQFICVFFKWISSELPWFSFILLQGLLCLHQSFSAFIMHDISFRYFSVSLKFAYLWYFAFADCFQCFSIRPHEFEELLEQLSSLPSTSLSIFSPGVYYFFKDYENMEYTELVKEKSGALLGLADFYFYNIMLLFVLPPLSSIETKIYIGIGCIIFIEIGYILTMTIGPYVDFGNETKGRAALPIPIIAFSAYFILLNIFMEGSNSNLCEDLDFFNYQQFRNNTNNIIPFILYYRN